MRKLFFLVTVMAFAASGSFAVARDANRDALSQQWKQVQADQKKQDAASKALDKQSKIKDEKSKTK